MCQTGTNLRVLFVLIFIYLLVEKFIQGALVFFFIEAEVCLFLWEHSMSQLFKSAVFLSSNSESWAGSGNIYFSHLEFIHRVLFIQT